ncbi:MAG: GNAT family N-acetyltransferase, partial [Rhodobacteraceae bacterium]|nr:GNAT family N-acetyltransferase [Paracoccaceae bacterium]
RTEAGPVEFGESRNLDWILARETSNRRRKRYRGWPHDFTKAFCQEPSAWRLYVVRHHGHSIAGGLFLIHGTRATYQIGWSGHEGRRHNAQTLLLWNAMFRLKSMGVSGLDLGQIDTINAPGLARFKLGTGAQPVRLGPTSLITAGRPKALNNIRPFHRKTSMQ